MLVKPTPVAIGSWHREPIEVLETAPLPEECQELYLADADTNGTVSSDSARGNARYPAPLPSGKVSVRRSSIGSMNWASLLGVDLVGPAVAAPLLRSLHKLQFSLVDGDTPSFRVENIKRVRNHFVPLATSK